eukprot:COSAG05_NODE_65_length_22456_cov_17.448540_8_plen_117_part_00
MRIDRSVTTVRLKIISHEIIKNVGKYQSCMFSKLPIIFKRTRTLKIIGHLETMHDSYLPIFLIISLAWHGMALARSSTAGPCLRPRMIPNQSRVCTRMMHGRLYYFDWQHALATWC